MVLHEISINKGKLFKKQVLILTGIVRYSLSRQKKRMHAALFYLINQEIQPVSLIYPVSIRQALFTL